jgi:hypothetical protein
VEIPSFLHLSSMSCCTSLSLNWEENKRLARRSVSPSTLSTKSSVPKIRSSVRTLSPEWRRLFTAEEIAEETGMHGKAAGGPLGAFVLLQKTRNDWLVMQRPDRKWEINPQHKIKIKAILKRFDI